jgi:hypothetical protein
VRHPARLSGSQLADARAQPRRPDILADLSPQPAGDAPSHILRILASSHVRKAATRHSTGAYAVRVADRVVRLQAFHDRLAFAAAVPVSE